MIAYFDIFSGISGDMILGAFIDIGVPVDWLKKELSNVLTGFSLKSEFVYKNNLKATNLVIDISTKENFPRKYKDIKELIDSSKLSTKVKKNSLTAFKKIAKAESYIHGKKIDDIHFHEIGSMDSIIDIVGSFLCVQYLKIKKVYASDIPLGSGFIDCAHGIIPVPVPAVLSILKKTPIKPSSFKTEVVTPTGAAIISTLTSDFTGMPKMVIKKTGYGSGKKDTGSKIPNLLRIILGKSKDKKKSPIKKENIYVVKTNIDDTTPEVAGFLMQTLFDSKALDAWFIPVQMKKNRPGFLIEVICRKTDLNKIIKIILSQTSSIGVRYYECERSFLKRKKAFVKTSFGKLQLKKITNIDKSVKFVPEYEVAKKVAKKNNKSLIYVYNKILSDANE